ncbi:MAG: hypothetical protein ACRC2O_05180, partial [Chitinophagaceae bacterium]
MPYHRHSPVEISQDDFKKMGYKLVDAIASFFATIQDRPVTTAESSEQLQPLLGSSSLPEKGMDTGTLISNATNLLLNHSLFNGHPKFMGYITGSPAPIGALADMLAAA